MSCIRLISVERFLVSGCLGSPFLSKTLVGVQYGMVNQKNHGEHFNFDEINLRRIILMGF